MINTGYDLEDEFSSIITNFCSRLNTIPIAPKEVAQEHHEQEVEIVSSQEEEPPKMVTDEVSKEGQMVEYSQLASQDTKVQTTRFKEMETTEGDPSQRERTLGRSDKGKEVA